MDSRAECIAQAAACLEKSGSDPARRDYWIGESIKWLERASRAGNDREGRARPEMEPARNDRAYRQLHDFHISTESTMAMDENETGTLIGSDKVEGTAVYGANNNKIGTIERVMIDKKSGRVSYAVLGFGGFLGLGNDHYPLPWQSLKYDTSLGGYVTGVTEQQLRDAPKYGNDNEWNWSDAARNRAVNAYYGVPVI
jgi:hypothetical protein